MTDYVKSTNFASKDSLASGNPLKIVKGTEIDTEFNNIATAVATKADLASPTLSNATLTGTAVAPTASTGDSSTKIATTAFVQTALQALYPVGSIYSSTVSTNPNTLFGFGTWVAYAAGRVLIGNGGGFSAGATGGSADAVVVSHTHTATVTDPGHSHTFTNYSTSSGGSTTPIIGSSNTTTTNTTNSNTTGISVSNSTTGVSGTNANLQPYVVVYMWNRTA